MIETTSREEFLCVCVCVCVLGVMGRGKGYNGLRTGSLR